MTDVELLTIAWIRHCSHGPNVYRGLNYVECRRCHFHVHTTGRGLIKHWSELAEYDPVPITEGNDPRLA